MIADLDPIGIKLPRSGMATGMAIVRCAENYFRVTGNFPWLDKQIGERGALDDLITHATYWKKLDEQGHGLVIMERLRTGSGKVQLRPAELANNAALIGSVPLITEQIS